MHKRVIVLGTGTEVGKTWVTAAVTAAARQRAVPALALKPIETGVDPQTEATSDATVLARASGVSAGRCYAYPDPVTPWLAAERRRQTIDLERVARWVEHHEQTRTNDNTLHAVSFFLIETAGGVFSPLSAAESNHELARILDPALWLLVAPNRLGVLHDVVASLEAMRARGRAADALVLNAFGPTDASRSSNADVLRRLPLACPIWEVSERDPSAGPELLARLLQLASA